MGARRDVAAAAVVSYVRRKVPEEMANNATPK